MLASSQRSPLWSAIRSKDLRIQVSMPSASTSTFIILSASTSSLSHSMKVRSSIAPIDILHHLLAARMLEVDVDVWRLQPLLGNEALEQKVDLGRIDGSDTEHIADGRIRRRSPALTKDALAARVAHDVVHGKEIM